MAIPTAQLIPFICTPLSPIKIPHKEKMQKWIYKEIKNQNAEDEIFHKILSKEET